MAPEIVRRTEYEGKPVDMWSLGILLYALLCGCFPFRAKAYPDLYRRIARGAFAMPEELSPQVKDLLRQLLTVEVDQRITAPSALRHAWLQSQLLASPNMDKLRRETTILISDKPADDLDEQVLSEMAAFGVSRDETIRLVLTKTHSSPATLYYLLLDMLVNRRRSSKRSNQTIGPSMQTPVLATGTTTQRPLSANYAGALANTSGNGVIKAVPAPMNRLQPSAQPTQPVQYDNLVEQQVAEQLANQQQQPFLERQEYRTRPKSASATQNRTITPPIGMIGSSIPTQIVQPVGGTAPAAQPPQQRPLSAYATRR
jgi:serine/threonine protein kinase